jgi:glutathione S-transferase
MSMKHVFSLTADREQRSEVRVGLALKGLSYESVAVHLVRNGGEHLLPSFKTLNPQAQTPLRDWILALQ